MSTDQDLQIWNTFGTWISGIGTLAACGIALWLARRTEKVQLKVYAGFRLLIYSDQQQECLNIEVTNLGERPVTISSIGWRIGRGKAKRHAIQPIPNSSPDHYPKKLEHGETANFIVKFVQPPDFLESSEWIKRFIQNFIKTNSAKTLKTLKLQIHTSVGHTENIKPEKDFLERIATAADI